MALNPPPAPVDPWTPMGVHEEAAMRRHMNELAERNTKMYAVMKRARDMISNQSGDITGAALDAWVLLGSIVDDE